MVYKKSPNSPLSRYHYLTIDKNNAIILKMLIMDPKIVTKNKN